MSSVHSDPAAFAAARGLDAATLRKTVSRMRQRFRHHLKAQIAPTLDDPATAADEMESLLAALNG